MYVIRFNQHLETVSVANGDICSLSGKKKVVLVMIIKCLRFARLRKH